MVKKYYLSSLGGFILCIWLTLLSATISILLVIYQYEVGVFPIIMSLFFVFFSLFGLFLCFWNSIKIDFNKKIISIIGFKIKKIALNEVCNIYITTQNSIDEKKYCHLIFKKNNGEEIVVNGFVSVFKCKDVEKTRILLNKIKADLSSIL